MKKRFLTFTSLAALLCAQELYAVTVTVNNTCDDSQTVKCWPVPNYQNANCPQSTEALEAEDIKAHTTVTLSTEDISTVSACYAYTCQQDDPATETTCLLKQGENLEMTLKASSDKSTAHCMMTCSTPPSSSR